MSGLENRMNRKRQHMLRGINPHAMPEQKNIGWLSWRSTQKNIKDQALTDILRRANAKRKVKPSMPKFNFPEDQS